MSMQICAVDTCVLMRLAAGDPAELYQETLTALQNLHTQHAGIRIVVHNMAIGECYISLQKHYGMTKPESGQAISMALTSGLVEPLDGTSALDVLQAAAAGGAGLIDRLLVLDAQVRQTIPLYTIDRDLARVADAVLLFSLAKT
jgi:hypothetical protein